jgi:RES domain-containing protein
MRVYRIAKALHSSTGAEMMSGEGGLHSSARWHTKGRLIVYTATSQALATLEIAVNLIRPRVIPAYRILEVQVPDTLVITIDENLLPTGWDRKDDEPLLARSVGDRWLSSLASAALRVPSSVIPQEYNVLLNPAHPDFARISYDNPLDFPFDPRIKE